MLSVVRYSILHIKVGHHYTCEVRCISTKQKGTAEKLDCLDFGYWEGENKSHFWGFEAQCNYHSRAVWFTIISMLLKQKKDNLAGAVAQ